MPADWQIVPLGSHASFRTGPFGTALHKSDYIDDGIPIINPMHIDEGKIKPTRSMSISEAAAKSMSEFRLKVGDLIIGRRGDMGRCALVSLDQSGWLCGTGSMIIRCGDDINADFLQRVLSSPQTIAAIQDASVGTTMVNLNQNTLRRLQIQFPTLEEQRAIAEALRDMDALLNALDQLITKKRNLKQAAMQQLLSGKTRLPGFNGDWQSKTLDELFDFSGGYSASRDQLSGDGYCYLHYGDIHGASKSYVDTQADYSDIPKLRVPLERVPAKSMLDNGDVVFVDASEDDEGTSKHLVVVNKDAVPFIAGLHTIVAKGKTHELVHDFRRYCFQTTAIRQQFLFYAAGTKVSGINKTNLARLILRFPDPPEQTAIATVLSDMDTELLALEQRIMKTRTLKQAMMQVLLTGQIRLVPVHSTHA